MKKSIFNKESLIDLRKNSILDQPYRITQILNFIFKNKVFDFSAMSSIPQNIRIALADQYAVLDIYPVESKTAKDGTVKYLFRLSDDNYIEAVILKDINERFTFCISSQSGCRLGCAFCKTHKMGLKRNLSCSEIISQIIYLSSLTPKHFNIVFMGMGEPLENFENLTDSIDIIINEMNISPTRITVSTCGIIEKIMPLLKRFPKIKLAVSLNSMLQEKREAIMPISKKYPVAQLIQTLYECHKNFKKRITLEYVLIKNFNMGHEDAAAFSDLEKDKFLINLIPLNSDCGEFMRPDEKSIKYFASMLQGMGLNVTRRYRRGEDIQADCGQLYWDSLGNSVG